MRVVATTELFSFDAFHDGGRYHIETSPLIYGANQWTGFYMITASVMKQLMRKLVSVDINIYSCGISKKNVK